MASSVETRPRPSSDSTSHINAFRSPIGASLLSEPRGRVGYRGRRIGLFILGTSLLLCLIAARLADIQILNSEQYIGDIDRHIAVSSISGSRGAILDRDGSVLAVTDTLPTIGANPEFVAYPWAAAKAIGPILGVSPESLIDKLTSSRDYIHLARQVTPDTAESIRKLQLAGIEIRDEVARRYPNGPEFARNILGRVDRDQTPLNGIELQFAHLLSGAPGMRKTFVSLNLDSIRLPGGDLSFEPAQPGQNLITTLHSGTQFQAERALLDAIQVNGAQRGTAIVLDVPTGQVLALVDVNRSEESGETYVAGSSGSYINVFEPGSATKPFTIAAALEEGSISDDQILDVPHRYQYSDKEFKEPYVNEDRQLSVREILAQSSNIGTIRIAERLGKDKLYHYLKNFGFGQFTSGQTDAPAWPDEAKGTLRLPQQWEGTGLATIAFGQGVSVTAMQLAAAFNTIANDGKYVAPSLILGTAGSDGVIHPIPPATQRQVIRATTAATMREMLTGVVTQGTGGPAKVVGYSVAGKTGTAMKTWSNKGEDGVGYSDDYTSIFAGFVPANDPAVTIVIVLDEPDEHLAGLTAAPVFSEIATVALRQLGIPETK